MCLAFPAMCRDSAASQSDHFSGQKAQKFLADHMSSLGCPVTLWGLYWMAAGSRTASAEHGLVVQGQGAALFSMQMELGELNWEEASLTLALDFSPQHLTQCVPQMVSIQALWIEHARAVFWMLWVGDWLGRPQKGRLLFTFPWLLCSGLWSICVCLGSSSVEKKLVIWLSDAWAKQRSLCVGNWTKI